MATGSLGAPFWAAPLQYQRGFFTLAFLLLLSRHGLYGLHAGAVEGAHSSFLVVGDSGCGKTTTTVSLVRSGWKYLSDDAVLLSAVDGVIEASAFSRGFSCVPEMQNYFPELALPGVQLGSMHRDKRLVNTEILFPGRFVSHTRPRVLLFPEVVTESESRLIRIKETDALARLIRQSPGVLSDRSAVTGQLDILRSLVESCLSYRLLLAADVRREPAALGRLLAGAAG